MLAHLVNKMWNRNFKKWNSRRIQRNRKKNVPWGGECLRFFPTSEQTTSTNSAKGERGGSGLRFKGMSNSNGEVEAAAGCSSWSLPVHNEDTAVVQASAVLSTCSLYSPGSEAGNGATHREQIFPASVNALEMIPKGISRVPFPRWL